MCQTAHLFLIPTTPDSSPPSLPTLSETRSHYTAQAGLNSRS